MIGLKNPLYSCVFLAAACVFFVSCGLGDSVEPPTGSKKNNPLNLEKISKLESELRIVKQDQTNLKQDIKHKTSRIKKLQGTIVTLEEKISVLEKKRADIVLPPSVLYRKARNLFIEETYPTAASLFNQLEKNYPEHHLADNAVYWLGECHYSMA